MEDRDFIDFKFGDHWASDFNLLAVSSGDRYSPPVYGSVNPNTATIAGKVGVYKWKTQVNEKVFNIKIAFDNINGQILNQIKEWLNPFKIDKLVFKEEPYKYYWVALNTEPKLDFLPFLEETKVVNGIAFKEGVYKGEFELQFVCFDNYGYSDWQSFDENYDYKIKEIEGEEFISFNDGSDNNLIITKIEGNSKQKVIEEVQGSIVSGEHISVNDVTLNDNGRITISGNSKQETREGYNLLNWGSFEPITQNGVTRTFIDTNIINFKGTPTQTGNIFARQMLEYNLDENTDYIFSAFGIDTNKIYISIGNIGDIYQETVSFNSGNAVEPNRRYFGLMANTTEAIDITIKFQLLKGTEIKPYEPYGASPSPDYPSEIVTVGQNVNLINAPTEYNFTATGTGQRFDITDYELIPGTMFYNFGDISGIGTLDPRLWLMSGNTVLKSSINKTSFTLTKEEISQITGVSIYIQGTTKGETYNIKAQPKLEPGTVETPYSPYGQGCINTIVSDNVANFPCESNSQQTSGIAYTGIYFEKINNFTYKIQGKPTEKEFRIGNVWNSLKAVTALQPNTTYSINKNFTETIQLTLTDGKAYKEIIVKGNTFNSETYTGISSLRINLNTNKTYDDIMRILIYTKSQTKVLPIQQEFVKIRDYKDTFIKVDGKWYEKHIIKKLILDENTNVMSFNTKHAQYNKVYFELKITDGLVIYGNNNNQLHPISNYFKSEKANIIQSADNNHIGCIGANNIPCLFFSLPYDKFPNAEAIKTWITELYNAGKPIIAYYILKEPNLIPCTPEQSKILDEIYNCKIYKPTTHLFSTNTINPIFTLKYNYVLPSPSPEVPSEVKTVGQNGSVEINVCNENFWDDKKIRQVSWGKYQDGVFTTNSNTSTTYGNFLRVFSDFNTEVGDYYLSLDLKVESGTIESINTLILINSKNENLLRGEKISAPTPNKDWQRYVFRGSLRDGNVGGIYIQSYNTNNCVCNIRNIMVSKIDANYTAHQSQTKTLPIQQEMLEGDYIKDVEHHGIGKYVFTGEEAVTISGSRFQVTYYKIAKGKTAQPSLCNISTYASWAETGKHFNVNNSDCYFTMDNFDFSTAEEMKAYLKAQYEAGTPVKIYYPLVTPIALELTEEQSLILNQLENELYSYEGTNYVFSTNEVSPYLSISYIPKQDIYIDYVVNQSNLLNDSAFYYNNNIYKKSYFDAETGDATKSGISEDRPVYLYNAGTTAANLNLTFDMIIPAEGSPLVINTESCKLTDNGIQVLKQISSISISDFSRYKPFLEIYDGTPSNWQIQIDSNLCEIYLKHKTDKTKIISLNKFNDNQSFLSLANCNFVDYSKPFPTLITAISGTALENTIFNKLSVGTSAQNYRLKNVNVEWRHTYL